MAAAKQKGPNWTLLIVGLVGVLALVGVLGSGFGKDPHRLETDALENKPAPRFVLQDLDGNTVAGTATLVPGNC